MILSHRWSYLLLSTQTITLLFCALGTYYLLHNLHTASSVLMGGLSTILPNAYLLLRMLTPQKTLLPKPFLRAFFACECIKFLLTALLCFISFAYLNAQAIPFFLGFIAPFLAFISFFTRYRKHL